MEINYQTYGTITIIATIAIVLLFIALLYSTIDYIFYKTKQKFYKTEAFKSSFFFVSVIIAGATFITFVGGNFLAFNQAQNILRNDYNITLNNVPTDKTNVSIEKALTYQNQYWNGKYDGKIIHCQTTKVSTNKNIIQPEYTINYSCVDLETNQPVKIDKQS